MVVFLNGVLKTGPKMYVLWPKTSGFQMVDQVTWLDHSKTGHKKLRTKPILRFRVHCVQWFFIFIIPKISEKLFVDDVTPTCERCNSLVKPDIVFFGESLPKKFSDSVQADFKNCDLLIVLGTSLTVQPFASLVDRWHFVQKSYANWWLWIIFSGAWIR